MWNNFETLQTKVVSGVATLSLHRPERLNAFCPLMRDELLAAFDEVDADDTIGAVVVIGSGRAFCAGGEIAERPAAAAGPDSAVANYRDDGGIVALRVFRCLKPVIAAINGAAVGFGATLPLAMDMRIASVKARFGFPFANLGVVPEAASTWFLPRIVGISRALEWCLSGRLIEAEEAVAAGLLRSIHPPEELGRVAHDLARSLFEKAAPVSVALTRQMLWRLSAVADPAEAHRVESMLLAARQGSRDMQEGIASFLAKRNARFPDRVSADLPNVFPWWIDPPAAPG